VFQLIKKLYHFCKKHLKRKVFALFSFKPTREEDLEKDLLAFIILCGSYFSSVGSRLMLRVRFDDPNNKKITY
jgi:hypothetical protein